MFGWCYFKKGVVGSHTNHYLKDNWKSLCGRYFVRIEERKFMHFVEKSTLRQRKICRTCEKLEVRKVG